jgi:hypothetical protein
VATAEAQAPAKAAALPLDGVAIADWSVDAIAVRFAGKI